MRCFLGKLSFNRSRDANVAVRQAGGNNSERDYLAGNVVNVRTLSHCELFRGHGAEAIT